MFSIACAYPQANPPLNADTAIAIEQNLRARHEPYGTILDPFFESPESDVVAHYTRCGDSAIWTGHYLAAASFRYAVTRSSEALEAVEFGLEGIRRLTDVTGRDVLARCAIPLDSPSAAAIVSEESANGVYHGELYGVPFLWIGNTSRDQYAGVFFGLTAAWNLVDVQDVHDKVSWLTTRLLDELTDRHWCIQMPNGDSSTNFLSRPDQQLSLLKLGRRLNPKRFESHYKALANSASSTVSVPIAYDVADQHSSYFKFNLAAVHFWNLLTSGDNSWIRWNYETAYNLFRRSTDDHGNAMFNLVDRAIKGPDARRDQETRELLAAWLERPRRDVTVDLTQRYEACGDRACQPIPVAERITTDYLWQRSPFQLFNQSYGYIEGAGLDFILPYWMARYYGVVNE